MPNTSFIDFPSPAKLNLFLHIVGQRDNGYHDLETIFQFLDYGDTISIKLNSSSTIDLLTPIDGVPNHDNLIVKAASLLQQHTQSQLGAQIKVSKVLPMGGGLGGGSSNAATVLLALNALWKTQLSTNELINLGVQLGADVPIFIHGYAAFAQGIGERLTTVTPQEYWYLITKPECSISTQAVFGDKELTRNTKKLSLDEVDIDKCHNDCESVVIKNYTEVAKLMSWLVEYAPSRMTGTGACIFSRFETESQARQLLKKLPAGINGFVAKGMNKSPLLDVIDTL